MSHPLASAVTYSLILMAAAGCATGLAHRNFKEIMQLQVGRDADSREFLLNRYHENRLGTRHLTNGNTEQAHRIPFPGGCVVFFEIDGNTNKIVGWRCEGADDVCNIPI